ncbi:MAG: hypothetical protein ACTHJW_24250 [Streptosporangiaceae bacterium]
MAVALFDKVFRLARRDARLTVGAAAVAAVIVAAVAAGVSGGSAPAPAERVAAASQHVAAKEAAADHAPAQAPSKDNSSKSPAAKSPAAKSPAAKSPAAKSPAAKSPAAKSSAKSNAARHESSKQKSSSQHQAARQHHSAPAKRRPYLIYDSVTPSALPAGNAAATYATGNYAASPSQVAGHKTVIWIDVTGYDHAASVLDVEPGDATPSMAASWASHRLKDNPRALARIYTMQSEWPAVKAAIAHLPAKMRSHVRYWIADPTGSPHIVPGSDATQWYWGKSYDISTATPRF